MRASMKRILVLSDLGGFIRLLTSEKKALKRIPSLKKVSVFKRLSCLLSGFNSDKIVFYDFDKYDKKLYINDYERFQICERLCGESWYIANDKLIFERLFKNKVAMVSSIGHILNGIFYKEDENCAINSFEDLYDEILASGKSVFLKPRDGGSGRGILKVCAENDGVTCENIKYNKSSFAKFLKKLNNYIVQWQFVQTGFSNEISPYSLNSIRVVTLLDPDTYEPFVMQAFHRFAREGGHLDNVASGGVFAPIDVEDGRLHKLRQYPVTGKKIYYEKHPDTGVLVEGVKIPYWDKICKTVIDLHKQLPFYKICGWDVILTGDGEIVIQELNYNPDTYVGQMDTPALLDKNTKRFYDAFIK